MTTSQHKNMAILVGGGPAPGINSVISAATIRAQLEGVNVLGIRDGFQWLMQGNIEHVHPLTIDEVSRIHFRGGSHIGIARANPTKDPQLLENAVISLLRLNVSRLVTIGGDDTAFSAMKLAEKADGRIAVVHVPKTIDNDLDKTIITFGFDTAVGFATESIDRLHSTAEAHRRIMVVEVMGRYAGWIALNAGISGNADAILIPEIPYDLEKVAAHIRRGEEAGQRHFIVVVAEGAKPKGGTVSTLGPREAGAMERLAGAGERVTKGLEELTGREARTVVLGHLLRGGSPSSFDRLLALRFGAAAVRALEAGHSGVMVALAPPTVNYVPLEEATNRMKTVPLDSDSILTARDLAISFGD